jgi:hypothetical protein
MGEMAFDLRCRRCDCRHQRRWHSHETVTATPCPSCREAMMVVGIAFFDATTGAPAARTARRAA